MDSAGWAQERYNQIRDALTPVLAQIGFRSPSPIFIPLSALSGENIACGTRPSTVRSKLHPRSCAAGVLPVALP